MALEARCRSDSGRLRQCPHLESTRMQMPPCNPGAKCGEPGHMCFKGPFWRSTTAAGKYASSAAG